MTILKKTFFFIFIFFVLSFIFLLIIADKFNIKKTELPFILPETFSQNNIRIFSRNNFKNLDKLIENIKLTIN